MSQMGCVPYTAGFESKFFLKDLDVQLAFQKDAKGQVTCLVMDRTGRLQRTSKKLK